jgi:Holliday junction DNA helicase RuvA
MITFLQGEIAEKQPTRVVLNVGGVGYEVFIPLSSYDRLPEKDVLCKILIYDHIREDRHDLFGFMTGAEREMFVLLMRMSGIGPKLALSALSGLSVRELKSAIIEGDVKRLSSISGIGKRMAERITVELKDKISDADAFEAVAGAEDLSENDLKTRDSVMALIALGYKQSDARKMVLGVLKKSPDMTVEEIIKASLGG